MEIMAFANSHHQARLSSRIKWIGTNTVHPIRFTLCRKPRSLLVEKCATVVIRNFGLAGPARFRRRQIAPPPVIRPYATRHERLLLHRILITGRLRAISSTLDKLLLFRPGNNRKTSGPFVFFLIHTGRHVHPFFFGNAHGNS